MKQINSVTLRRRRQRQSLPDSRQSPSKEGAKGNSSVALQNPADAQWPRNGRVTILEYEKV
jgi:hypothetical protein